MLLQLNFSAIQRPQTLKGVMLKNMNCIWENYIFNIRYPTKVPPQSDCKITWWLAAVKTDMSSSSFSESVTLWGELPGGGARYSCHMHKVRSYWLGELSKRCLHSFALLVCERAKLTSLSIKIETTLAKQEIGPIHSFVCKHEEENYTNGSSVILHYGPL